MATLFKSAVTGTFLFTFVLCLDAYAQKETELFTAKNTIFVEVGGNAGRYAASYGRIFHQKGLFKLSGSAGFSMWHHNTSSPFDPSSPPGRSTYWLPVLPLEISALLGKSKHHLEIGTGITSYLRPSARVDPTTSRRTSDKVVLSGEVPIRVGYRYQKPEGGFFLRVAYTPSYWIPGNAEDKAVFQPIWAGLSLGISF